jgi:hypothetical protein
MNIKTARANRPVRGAVAQRGLRMQQFLRIKAHGGICIVVLAWMILACMSSRNQLIDSALMGSQHRTTSCTVQHALESLLCSRVSVLYTVQCPLADAVQ